MRVKLSFFFVHLPAPTGAPVTFDRQVSVSVPISPSINFAPTWFGSDCYLTAPSARRRRERELMNDQFQSNRLNSYIKGKDFECESVADCAVDSYHLLSLVIDWDLLDSNAVIYLDLYKSIHWPQFSNLFVMLSTDHLDLFSKQYVPLRTLYCKSGIATP